MDRGLKERLVGAAVLVALGVWLIPWVLDGPDDSARDEVETLELPASPDAAPLRSQTITLGMGREPPVPLPEALTRELPVIAETNAPAISSAPETRLPESNASSTPELNAAPGPAVRGTSELVGSGWFVQAGSFADESNAQRQAGRVSSLGYDAQVLAFVTAGRTVQRIRVGPYASRELAEVAASSLSAHGFVVQVVAGE
jgi:cell division septation protein DedD